MSLRVHSFGISSLSKFCLEEDGNEPISSNVVVTNNTVANSVNVGFKMHRANNCVLSNNTSYNNARYQVLFQNNSNTSDMYNITMKHNRN